MLNFISHAERKARVKGCQRKYILINIAQYHSTYTHDCVIFYSVKFYGEMWPLRRISSSSLTQLKLIPEKKETKMSFPFNEIRGLFTFYNFVGVPDTNTCGKLPARTPNCKFFGEDWMNEKKLIYQWEGQGWVVGVIMKVSPTRIKKISLWRLGIFFREENKFFLFIL